MLLSGAQYGGPGLGDGQPGDEGPDAGGGGRLALVLPTVPGLNSGYHQTPLTGVLAMQN